MKSVKFSIKNKIILLTVSSMLGSNLILFFLLFIKNHGTSTASTPDGLLNFLNAFISQHLTSVSLLFIIASTLLCYFFVHKITTPLQNLVFASNQLGADDISSINFPKDSNDELAVLASSLENMNKTIIKQNESLKNSEIMNRSIMDNMNDGLITLTTDGLINSLNKEAETLFGYAADEIQGRQVSMLISEPHKADLDNFLRKHLLVKLVVGQNTLEVLGIRKDCSVFPMELSITEMTFQNRKAESKRFFIGLCRNIEERKKNESKLRKAEKIALAARDEAERANLAKSQFLSRMSHEFRTPLNAVMGYSQLALYDEEFKGDKTVMQSIYDAGENLLAMVSNVLDIASAETGALTVDLQAVDAVQTVKEVYQQAIKLAEKGNVEISLSIKASSSPLLIKADKDRLKQVLIILITNAIKFNRKPGKVVLALREANKNRIGISVKDQGIGIAKGNLPLIFKPFERLDAYNLGIDGLGIGLAIAKQLTENMGGVIGVESEEQVGSLFYVFFPAYHPELEQPVPEDALETQSLSEV